MKLSSELELHCSRFKYYLESVHIFVQKIAYLGFKIYQKCNHQAELLKA
jgi:hypothetical protein